MISDPHVGLGHVLVAIAEPHARGLDTYHRWFERDHMYSAVLIGPGAFAGERYVATRELKALRHPPDGGVFPSIDVGSFVALYFLAEGSVEEHFAWSFPQSARLAAAGRSNPDRDLILTWLCDYRGSVTRDPDSVSPEIALDHRYEGLVMVWVEATPPSSIAALEQWLREDHLPATLRDSSIDQVQLFAPRDFPKPPPDVALTPGSIVPNAWSDRGLLLLYFLEASPLDDWARRFTDLEERLSEGGYGRVALVAPFLPTQRGTRRHLDEIW